LFQRVVRFAKITALLSAVWTTTCAAMIVWRQVLYGEMDTYTLSSIVSSINGGQHRYVTASSDKFEAELTFKEVAADWLLAIPTIVPLLIVAALLLAFYLRLAILEKTFRR
jgi:hypothetical protein